MHVLRSYFSEVVTLTRSTGQFKIDDNVLTYVINLLCEYSHVDAIDINNGIPTLVSLLESAVHSSGRIKYNAYKRLGDMSLFLSGFYSQYVESTGGIRYYIDMGTGAYANASSVSNKHMMGSLARDFCDIALLLNDASHTINLGTKYTLAQMIELHDKAPTNVTLKKLIDLGATPVYTLARG